MTTEPPSSKKYDPTLSTCLVARARELTAGTYGEFSFPDMRAVDLAIRLVAPGPKAAAVSASECHEIAEFVIAAYDRDAFPVRARKALITLADQLETLDARSTERDRELTSQLEIARAERDEARQVSATAVGDGAARRWEESVRIQHQQAHLIRDLVAERDAARAEADRLTRWKADVQAAATTGEPRGSSS